MSTPQQYNKKTGQIGQGLDFFNFWGGNLRKTTGKAKDILQKNKENKQKFNQIRKNNKKLKRKLTKKKSQTILLN